MPGLSKEAAESKRPFAACRGAPVGKRRTLLLERFATELCRAPAVDQEVGTQARTSVRKMYRGLRRERLISSQHFLDAVLARTLSHFADGNELDLGAIAVRTIKVVSYSDFRDFGKIPA